MSKHHIRTEKNCLNCGTIVEDRYCSHCGQENVEPRESVWHMVVHFFNDITHFDGKFFSTIKLLFTKPGFLSEEYMNGRRTTYLNPIRMYLFVSFLLFFLWFSLPKPTSDSAPRNTDVTYGEAMRLRDSLRAADSVRQREVDTVLNGPVSLWRVEDGNFEVETDQNSGISGFLNRIEDTTVAQYESRQERLPKQQRDGFFEQWAARRYLAIEEYRAAHPKTFNKDVGKIFLHSIPKMLFVSIPIFAFLLWLLYVRSRKQYYFVTHGIFTIHLYCAIYLLIIVLIPFRYIDHNRVKFLMGLAFIILPAFYLYKAMRRFYKQGRGKTILKFSLLIFSSLFVFLLLMLIFSVNSVLSVASGSH